MFCSFEVWLLPISNWKDKPGSISVSINKSRGAGVLSSNHLSIGISTYVLEKIKYYSQIKTVIKLGNTNKDSNFKNFQSLNVSIMKGKRDCSYLMQHWMNPGVLMSKTFKYMLLQSPEMYVAYKNHGI